jgi:hypothetical protein
LTVRISIKFDNPAAGAMMNGEPTLVANERATFVGVVCARTAIVCGFSLLFALFPLP